MLTFEMKMAYLAAFIDAEGWITCNRPDKGGKLSRQIGFTNTNKALLDRVLGFCAEAGLEFRIGTPEPRSLRHSQRYNAILVGGRKAYERFAALVPVQHPEKLARLEMICAGYLSTEEAGRRRAAAWRASMTYERQVEIANIARAVQRVKRIQNAASI